MGARIKKARLRRNLSVELVAERAGSSRATIWSVKKGTPTVSLGTYAAVLHALSGMDKDLELVAKDDEFGRRLHFLRSMMISMLVPGKWWYMIWQYVNDLIVMATKEFMWHRR